MPNAQLNYVIIGAMPTIQGFSYESVPAPGFLTEARLKSMIPLSFVDVQYALSDRRPRGDNWSSIQDFLNIPAKESHPVTMERTVDEFTKCVNLDAQMMVFNVDPTTDNCTIGIYVRTYKPTLMLMVNGSPQEAPHDLHEALAAVMRQESTADVSIVRITSTPLGVVVEKNAVDGEYTVPEQPVVRVDTGAATIGSYNSGSLSNHPTSEADKNERATRQFTPGGRA